MKKSSVTVRRSIPAANKQAKQRRNKVQNQGLTIKTLNRLKEEAQKKSHYENIFIAHDALLKPRTIIEGLV